MLWKILESFTSFVTNARRKSNLKQSQKDWKFVKLYRVIELCNRLDNCYNEFINSACSIIDQMRLIFFGIVQGFP